MANDRVSTHGRPLDRLLVSTANRVIRPRDLSPYYTNPRDEAARLVERGDLRKLATGYFLVVPDDRRATDWRPPIEDLALALAVADYGEDAVALMGPSAARVLGLLPRALAGAVVAVPKQRPPLATAFGRLEFVTRDIRRLDWQRYAGVLCEGYTTTVEQTALDIASRPGLGGLTPAAAEELLSTLAAHADLTLVDDLAARQRRRPAAARVRAAKDAGGE